MNEHPIFALTSEMLSILDEEKIPYMLMGGLSVRFWALPRPTYDLDLTIAAGEAQVAALLDRTDRQGFVIPPDAKRGWRATLAGMKNTGGSKIHRP